MGWNHHSIRPSRSERATYHQPVSSLVEERARSWRWHHHWHRARDEEEDYFRSSSADCQRYVSRHGWLLKPQAKHAGSLARMLPMQHHKQRCINMRLAAYQICPAPPEVGRIKIYREYLTYYTVNLIPVVTNSAYPHSRYLGCLPLLRALPIAVHPTIPPYLDKFHNPTLLVYTVATLHCRKATFPTSGRDIHNFFL